MPRWMDAPNGPDYFDWPQYIEFNAALNQALTEKKRNACPALPSHISGLLYNIQINKIRRPGPRADTSDGGSHFSLALGQVKLLIPTLYRVQLHLSQPDR